MTTIEMTDAEVDAGIIAAAKQIAAAEKQMHKLTHIKSARLIERQLNVVESDMHNHVMDCIMADFEPIPDDDEQLDLSRPERFDHESNMIG